MADITQPEFDFTPKLHRTYGVAGFYDLLEVLNVGRIAPEKSRFIFNCILHATLDKPMTAGAMSREWYSHMGQEINSAIVRKVASCLRCEHALPVGSFRDGYYWPRNADELEPTIAHLTRRLVRIQNDLGAVQKCEVAMRMAEMA